MLPPENSHEDGVKYPGGKVGGIRGQSFLGNLATSAEQTVWGVGHPASRAAAVTTLGRGQQAKRAGMAYREDGGIQVAWGQW